MVLPEGTDEGTYATAFGLTMYGLHRKDTCCSVQKAEMSYSSPGRATDMSEYVRIDKESLLSRVWVHCF
jgi:hypothetical protein